MSDITEDGCIQTLLPENPTVINLRSHTDEISKEGKTVAIIQIAFTWWYYHQDHYSENCQGSLG